MEMLNSGVMLTKEQISAFEQALEISLPEDYVNFLLQHNGGYPKEDMVFDFEDGVLEAKNTTSIRDFFRIYLQEEKGTYDDLGKICRIMWGEETMAKNMIAIADDPGGNPIFLCVAGENRGKVYMGNQDYEDADTGYLFMSEVAPSFTAFLNMLYRMD